MIKINNTTSTFTWTTSEQVYPFEKGPGGETLYAKYIDCGGLPNNTVKTVAHGLSSPFTVVRQTVMAQSTAANVHSFLPYSNPNVPANALQFFLDATNCNIGSAVNATAYDKCKVYLIYYKA